MSGGHLADAQQQLLRAALNTILAADYGQDDDRYAGDNADYRHDQLALAARKLVQAIDALPTGHARPVGWPPGQAAEDSWKKVRGQARRWLEVSEQARHVATTLADRYRVSDTLARELIADAYDRGRQAAGGGGVQ